MQHRLATCPAKAILVHEQGQTPDSLKRSYENAPLGQKWAKYAVSWLRENDSLPHFLLIDWFGDFRKLVSFGSLLSSFQQEYSGGLKRLLSILLLVFSIGVEARLCRNIAIIYQLHRLHRI